MPHGVFMFCPRGTKINDNYIEYITWNFMDYKTEIYLFAGKIYGVGLFYMESHGNSMENFT